MKLSDLFESRNNFLYHGTNVYSALSIMQSNTIKAKTLHFIDKSSVKKKNRDLFTSDNKVLGVSLSRNIRIAVSFADKELNGVVFCLNYDNLYRDYGKRIIPIDYFKTTFIKKNPDFVFDKSSPYYVGRDNDSGEAEEFVLGNINNVTKYIDVVYLTVYMFKEELSDKQEQFLSLYPTITKIYSTKLRKIL